MCEFDRLRSIDDRTKTNSIVRLSSILIRRIWWFILLKATTTGHKVLRLPYCVLNLNLQSFSYLFWSKTVNKDKKVNLVPTSFSRLLADGAWSPIISRQLECGNGLVSLERRIGKNRPKTYRNDLPVITGLVISPGGRGVPRSPIWIPFWKELINFHSKWYPILEIGQFLANFSYPVLEISISKACSGWGAKIP